MAYKIKKYKAKVKDWNTGKNKYIYFQAKNKKEAKNLIDNSLRGRNQNWNAKIKEIKS